MTELRLSPAAESDLLAIRKYSVENFGNMVTMRYLDGFEEAFRLLKTASEAGRQRSETGQDIRSLVVGSHSLF